MSSISSIIITGGTGNVGGGSGGNIDTSKLVYLDINSSIQGTFNSVNSALSSKFNSSGGNINGNVTIASNSFLYANSVSAASGNIAITAPANGSITLTAASGLVSINTGGVSRFSFSKTGAMIRDYEVLTVPANNSITITKSITVINAPTTVAALTVTFPTDAVSGQCITISCNQVITATTFTAKFASGFTPGAETFIVPGASVTFMYSQPAPLAGWVRIG